MSSRATDNRKLKTIFKFKKFGQPGRVLTSH